MTDNSKLLGVAWDKLQDKFTFEFKVHLMKCLTRTKRSILKVTASLFDFLAIFTIITLKMLFQGLSMPMQLCCILVPPTLMVKLKLICCVRRPE